MRAEGQATARRRRTGNESMRALRHILASHARWTRFFWLEIMRTVMPETLEDRETLIETSPVIELLQNVVDCIAHYLT